MKQINLIAAVLLVIFSTACAPGESVDGNSILSSRHTTVIGTPSQDCPYCVRYNLKIEYPSSETARTNLLNELFACGEDISGLDMGELSKRIIDRASMEDISFLEELWQDHRQTGYRYAADTLSHSFDCSFLGNVRGYDNMEYTEEIFLGTAHPDISCKHVVLDSKGYVCALEDVLKPGSVSGLTPVVKQSAEVTAYKDCIGPAKLVVFCNAPEDNPFMAGAFHGAGEPDCVINVGVSGPGVVRSAISRIPDANITEIAEMVKRTAFKITRVGQLVANEASRRLDVPFGIVDLSLAPTPAVGDSVAYILEEMGLEQCGAHGTTACLALLNDAVKKGGVMASSSVGGLSGAFIPVSEDAGMINAARSGCLRIEKLEAMTAVCSVGLDMIVIPGDTTPAVISAIIADEAAIGMVNSKTTAVRVIPAVGKNVGDELEFGGLLGSGPVMPINTKSPEKFISRGGRIPAPLQSLKN